MKRLRRHLPKRFSSRVHSSRLEPAGLFRRWRFFIAYQDDETSEITGTIGEAQDQEECEVLIDDEAQYHRSDGRTIVSVEIGKMLGSAGRNGKIRKAKIR